MEVNGTEEKGGRVPSSVKGLLSHVQISIYSFWQDGQLIPARFCRRAVGVWKWTTEGILRIYMGRGREAQSQLLYRASDGKTREMGWHVWRCKGARKCNRM